LSFILINFELERFKMRRTWIVLVFLSLLISCKTVSVGNHPSTTHRPPTSSYRELPESFHPPIVTTETASTKQIQLWATYYHLPTLNHAENGIPLLDINESALPLKLAPTDWCTAAIQGSAYVQKGDQIYLVRYGGRSEIRQFDCRECSKYRNYQGYDQTGKVRWMIGDKGVFGGSGLKLVAMKSLAVDPTVIPYKSVVYIPEAVGVLYVNEEGDTVAHDGYFLAADTGSMIKGNHIDVFIGTATKNPFGFVRSDENQSFKALVVSDGRKQFELLYLHQ
jgi:3D (Asp-Asp-Asp) domain-containing protein